MLDHKSECESPPIDVPPDKSGSSFEGCWHPKTFDKAVVIIIDALRYDFTVPFNGDTHLYHNALNVLHETATQRPQNAFLLPFIADPPTATLQRLKGLTTGTLPTFIDAGSNFAGTAIEEDNLVAQLRDSGKTLVHLGDDTWHSLFPGYFDANLSHAYDSFNVWDLHTVDNGVTEHLLPLLSPSKTSQWDVIFGHYLGVDHAGHRYGPDHPAMAAKLSQMDGVLREIIASIDDTTLLVVMGDHGMDTKGDHGGESDDEIEAALWMYTKRDIFGRSLSKFIKPPMTAKERPVAQIDLVPTLSLLLGLPIPFNNLGAPIEEAFIGHNPANWKNLAFVNALTGGQINRYQQEYALARGLDESVTSGPRNLWTLALQIWTETTTAKSMNSEQLKAASAAFSNYQKETLRICRSLWARFDIPSMLCGIGILLLSVIILVLYARSIKEDRAEHTPNVLQKISLFSVFGLVIGGTTALVVPDISFINTSVLGLAAGGMAGFSITFIKPYRGLSIPFPNSTWSWFALVFTISQAIGFASNSYTIWEDEILLFFLSTFAFLAFVSSMRQSIISERILGTYQSSIFIVLTRLVSLSRLCREEQMPFCRSTYYASTTSSTSAPWQLLIPFALAIALPSVIKSFYNGTRSYEGSAAFWIGFAVRLALLGSAIFWTLDAADDGDWFTLNKGTLKSLKTIIAQLVLGVAFAAGSTTFVWAKPCINIRITPTSNDPANERTASNPNSVTILGYANTHGSHYFLLVSNWILATTLIQKPMGGGATGILAWQILALLEIIDSNGLSQSAIGPIVLALLGSFHFFKTGHQATLSSIQWESAFIPMKTIQYPWSPLLVILNTYGAQILTTVAVPLVVLWKRPPKKKGLLRDVGKAMATHILYYATINLATAMWAGWLRRHLMLYRIFSPRFMSGAAVLLVVDLVGIFVAIAGMRWNVLSVAEVFGWE